MLRLLFIVFLYSCQQVANREQSNQMLKDSGTHTASTIEHWCMYQRIGFRGDTVITSINKLSIEKDSIVSFLMDNKVVYRDTIYKKPDYTYDFLLRKHGGSILKIDSSRKLLIHFPDGEDGDEQFYRPCNN